MMMTMVTEENFQQEVLASSVPVFVHFQAPWCGICRLISPVLTSVQPDWPTSLKIVAVNADDNLKLANRYQLKTLPTLLYIQDGTVLHRIEGFKSREALRAQLNGIAHSSRFSESILSHTA